MACETPCVKKSWLVAQILGDSGTSSLFLCVDQETSGAPLIHLGSLHQSHIGETRRNFAATLPATLVASVPTGEGLGWDDLVQN